MHNHTVKSPIQRSRCLRGVAGGLLFVLLYGCAAPPPAPPLPSGAPLTFPLEEYVGLPADTVLYRVDETRSLLRVLVYRGGRLARLGHDHVVAGRTLAGLARARTDDGMLHIDADLYVALAALTVDDEALRAEAGFESTPSAEDKDGTRRNMLKSLNALEQPFAEVSVSVAKLPIRELGRAIPVSLEVRLHGQTRQIPAEATLERTADTLSVSGNFKLMQSDFGIQPFSILGGAVAVRDEVHIDFHVVAVQAPSPAPSTH